MDDLPRERAARLQRPSWRDARLLIGLALVLASVALGAQVVAAADSTTAVYATAATLPSGHSVTRADLRVVRVHLNGGLADYLSATAPIPPGLVTLRALGRGELVPSAALGGTAGLTRRPVSIPVEVPVPAGVRAGALVDLWHSARDPAAGPTGSAGFRRPVRLAADAEVAGVTGQSSGLGAGRDVSVQVLLEEADLTAALDALANGGRLTLIPTGAGVAAGGAGGVGGAG